jgi:hypothetical protein
MAYVLSVVLAACGDSSETPDDQADADVGPTIDAGSPDASPACAEAAEHSDFTWIRANIFAKSCALGTACHASEVNPNGGLSLSEAMAFAQLVDVDSTQEPGKKRVVPGDCDASYLYQKITNTGIASNKKPMPPPSGGVWPSLCVEKQQAICNWIAAGAMND